MKKKTDSGTLITKNYWARETSFSSLFKTEKSMESYRLFCARSCAARIQNEKQEIKRRGEE